MSRLYSYRQCEVVVMPQLEDIGLFPEGTGVALMRNGQAIVVSADGTVRVEGSQEPILCREVVNCTGDEARLVLSGLQERAGELIEVEGVGGVRAVFFNHCAWGIYNPEAYNTRGWCCSEYSIARFTSRIVRSVDPQRLQEIEDSRRWPSTVTEVGRPRLLAHAPHTPP